MAIFRLCWKRMGIPPSVQIGTVLRYAPLTETISGTGHATHGYLPEKGPQPTFMAVGPSFRENVWLDSAAMIDEAPTFAALLGVPLPAADGKVLQELLR